MRHAAWLFLVVLSACNENLSHAQPPMDRFFYPAGVALTTVATPSPAASGNQALLVVSANFDLHYDKQEGATLLSVDPGLYDEASGAGSLGRPNGDLLKLGPGAQLGSYAGPVAVADAVTCPSQAGGPQAFVASRYTRKLYRFPIGAGGEVSPCTLGRLCQFDLDPDLLDPAPVGVACRADGLRKSLYVAYLHSPTIAGIGASTAWLSEFDIDNLGAPPRTIPLAPGPVSDMAYDALADRLYAVGRFAGLTAPLFILDLRPCSSADRDSATAPCPGPWLQTVDLFSALAGAELVGIALSNPQPGLPRRAYIAARTYDEGYAISTRSRPPFDVGGALMVVDLDEDLVGQPLARVRSVIPIGLGAGAVRVLPLRPGLADLVVVPSSGDGTISVYDDEVGAIVRVVSLDEASGAPEAGHAPYGAVVEDRGGGEALVYIASFRDSTVSVLRVSIADPTSADLVRYPAGSPLQGSPIRIGRQQQ
jgi:hypothetical protein